MTSFRLTLAALLTIAAGAVAWANIPLLGVGTGGSAAPPSSCDGTIDLSTGCVQPMLGVL